MNQEEQHLQKCQEIIGENIKLYEEKVSVGKQETEELYAAVQAGEVELYNQLIVSLDIQEHNENALRKNKAALHKPYFGRVDYKEVDNNKVECLYIGKNGISKNRTEIIIVDWRAPVSSLYYENELGFGSYEVPGGDSIGVDLQLKRTYDMDNGQLIGYYDSDVAANDELLVKYLAKNKDVVLGDIIATIQKEQNEIIRARPFTNLIVQGVAGSGKTTVAMHRISYILYNYDKRFAPEEFCIIGSNDMLLSYITSGLPELDVRHVGQMRMDLFFCHLMEKNWKKKYKIIEVGKNVSWKSQLSYIKRLELWLTKQRDALIPISDVQDSRLRVVLSAENIKTTLEANKETSVQQLINLLNDRLKTRIRFLVDEDNDDLYRQKIKEFRGYFKLETSQKDIVKYYLQFLLEFGIETHLETAECISEVQKGYFDVYDLAALVLIQRRLIEKKSNEDYGQLIVDEAQDFGVMVYYVLRQALPKCYFTIMGDVSQNINYETGMNSWDELSQQVFQSEKKQFYVLAKSYRNTIEISEYAGQVLEKASAGIYKIQPVIRHGRPVQLYQLEKGKMIHKTAAIIKEIKERGFDSVAIICKTTQEANELEQELTPLVNVHQSKDMNFQKGILVLPIHLTKGLEFDTVILWNPDEEHYKETVGDAKLLYVAITRALHELHIIYCEGLSKVLEEN